MSENETMQVLLIIANEYDNFLPESDEGMEIKLNTWHEALKSYEFKHVSQITGKLLQTHTYGTPKLAHLMTLLNPVMESQNIGQEFAERFVYLIYRLGVENMEGAIYREYGEIGREIYLNNKFDARNLLEADIPTFKAQIRNSFNSKYERQQKGHDVIENKAKFMIESQLKAVEVIRE